MADYPRPRRLCWRALEAAFRDVCDAMLEVKIAKHRHTHTHTPRTTPTRLPTRAHGEHTHLQRTAGSLARSDCRRPLSFGLAVQRLLIHNWCGVGSAGLQPGLVHARCFTSHGLALGLHNLANACRPLVRRCWCCGAAARARVRQPQARESHVCNAAAQPACTWYNMDAAHAPHGHTEQHTSRASYLRLARYKPDGKPGACARRGPCIQLPAAMATDEWVAPNAHTMPRRTDSGADCPHPCTHTPLQSWSRKRGGWHATITLVVSACNVQCATPNLGVSHTHEAPTSSRGYRVSYPASEPALAATTTLSTSLIVYEPPWSIVQCGLNLRPAGERVNTCTCVTSGPVCTSQDALAAPGRATTALEAEERRVCQLCYCRALVLQLYRPDGSCAAHNSGTTQRRAWVRRQHCNGVHTWAHPSVGRRKAVASVCLPARLTGGRR